MSQAKVDRYKEEKANRQKIIKKEKREKLIWKIGCYVVVLALVVWIGYSAFDRFYEAPIRYYDADSTALDDYLSGLNQMEAAEDETEAESAAEDETEAESAAEDETEAESAAEDETEAESAAEEVTEAESAAEEATEE